MWSSLAGFNAVANTGRSLDTALSMTAPAFTFETTETSVLAEPALARVLALFRAAYRAANDDYFRRSLTQLRFLATATCGRLEQSWFMPELAQPPQFARV